MVKFLFWWPTMLFNFFAGDPDTIIGWIIYIIMQGGWWLFLFFFVIGLFVKLTGND